MQVRILLPQLTEGPAQASQAVPKTVAGNTVGGSSPSPSARSSFRPASIAQRSELPPLKRWVPGSNPGGGTAGVVEWLPYRTHDPETRFESDTRHWHVVQSAGRRPVKAAMGVRISPCQRYRKDSTRGRSSARESTSFAPRRSSVRFRPVPLRTTTGLVAQQVRAPACHAGGRGFESRRGRFPPGWRSGSASRSHREGRWFESSTGYARQYGRMAQLVEHRLDTAEVPGSSPGAATVVVAQRQSAGLWSRTWRFDPARPHHAAAPTRESRAWL
jgi:hypothetical protein